MENKESVNLLKKATAAWEEMYKGASGNPGSQIMLIFLLSVSSLIFGTIALFMLKYIIGGLFAFLLKYFWILLFITVLVSFYFWPYKNYDYKSVLAAIKNGFNDKT